MKKSLLAKLFIVLSVFVLILLTTTIQSAWAGSPAQTVPTQVPSDTARVVVVTVTDTPNPNVTVVIVTQTLSDTEVVETYQAESTGQAATIQSQITLQAATDQASTDQAATQTAAAQATGQPLSTITPTPTLSPTPTPGGIGGIVAGLQGILTWVLLVCGILVLALVILIITLVVRRRKPAPVAPPQ
ncbi:MAG: hypothetical protein P4L50_12615 [Anaerolineaceae bacterium]|nr:hypothetical protein [Anaerolineaceae bacterium]